MFKELINITNEEIINMPDTLLHQNFMKIRSEINRLSRTKQRSIELEIIYCYLVKEIQDRS